MAASPSSLEEDLTCSVCCDIFRGPVLLGCGHNFCLECLGSHWSSSPGRRCPLCQHSSPRQPLLNISLRSTCEFLRQQQQKQQRQRQQQQQQQQQRDAAAQRRKKEKRKKDEEEERAWLCSLHGQRLLFFCETEGKPVCTKCKDSRHKGHRVLSLQRALKERQAKLSTAIRPLKQTQDLLKSGSNNIAKSQVEDTKRKIKKDFEELHKFLLDEEEARLSVLIHKADSCNSAWKAEADGQISNLSQKLKDLEEKMEMEDDLRFLQDFNSILLQAQSSEPESALPAFSGSSAPATQRIDVTKHVGNLKFRVWEKMKEIAPYYPVTLDPHAPLCFLSLSDDLAGVSRVDNKWPLFSVPGSEGIADDNFHSWDVDVGDEDAEWMLGLTIYRLNLRHSSLSPEGYFWAIRKSGGEFQALTAVTSVTRLHLTSRTRVVRVQLWRPLTLRDPPTRSLRLLDAQTGTEIHTFNDVPCQVPVYPFLLPTKMSSPLRLMPAQVTVLVKEEASFMQKHANTFTTVATTCKTVATTCMAIATTVWTSATAFITFIKNSLMDEHAH
ncbi:zinc-binding protein A33-like [Sardina pilchardus]|uniref:zinc-binding protein A33-like n=1 Tax=Sardina pilchardus TaxID=27697 RepID=UPI002E0E64D0